MTSEGTMTQDSKSLLRGTWSYSQLWSILSPNFPQSFILLGSYHSVEHLQRTVFSTGRRDEQTTFRKAHEDCVKCYYVDQSLSPWAMDWYWSMACYKLGHTAGGEQAGLQKNGTWCQKGWGQLMQMILANCMTGFYCVTKDIMTVSLVYIFVEQQH